MLMREETIGNQSWIYDIYIYSFVKFNSQFVTTIESDSMITKKRVFYRFLPILCVNQSSFGHSKTSAGCLRIFVSLELLSIRQEFYHCVTSVLQILILLEVTMERAVIASHIFLYNYNATRPINFLPSAFILSMTIRSLD